MQKLVRVASTTVHLSLCLVQWGAGRREAFDVRTVADMRNVCRCRSQHFALQVRIIAVVEQMGAWDSMVSFQAAPASAASTSLRNASTTQRYLTAIIGIKTLALRRA